MYTNRNNRNTYGNKNNKNVNNIQKNNKKKISKNTKEDYSDCIPSINLNGDGYKNRKNTQKDNLCNKNSRVNNRNGEPCYICDNHRPIYSENRKINHQNKYSRDNNIGKYKQNIYNESSDSSELSESSESDNNKRHYKSNKKIIYNTNSDTDSQSSHIKRRYRKKNKINESNNKAKKTIYYDIEFDMGNGATTINKKSKMDDIQTKKNTKNKKSIEKNEDDEFINAIVNSIFPSIFASSLNNNSNNSKNPDNKPILINIQDDKKSSNEKNDNNMSGGIPLFPISSFQMNPFTLGNLFGKKMAAPKTTNDTSNFDSDNDNEDEEVGYENIDEKDLNIVPFSIQSLDDFD
jgi:hypothetical protein